MATTASITAGPQISKDWPILLVHNHYQQPGGEDRVFAADAALLEQNGHNVIRFEEHNNRIPAVNPIALAIGTIWNREACRELDSLMARVKPRIVHFHNTFPLISPAAYEVARQHRAAVVQTLHNFRLVCGNGLLFRNGKPCEDCLDANSPWPGVYHRCYRDGFLPSAVVAAMITIHQKRRTWIDNIDAFIALSDFSRDRFIRAGLPAEAISVKSNSIEFDSGPGDGSGGYAVFAGRLSREKGLTTLIEGWKRLIVPIPLRIFGEGPLSDWLQRQCALMPHVQWRGWESRGRVLTELKAAAVLIFPSECYEAAAAPNIVIEALAAGLPVIASDSGETGSMIERADAGSSFRSGDPADLAFHVRTMMARTDLPRLRRNARAQFDRYHASDSLYAALTGIYAAASLRCREACA